MKQTSILSTMVFLFFYSLQINAQEQVSLTTEIKVKEDANELQEKITTQEEEKKNNF